VPADADESYDRVELGFSEDLPLVLGGTARDQLDRPRPSRRGADVREIDVGLGQRGIGHSHRMMDHQPGGVPAA
jgi:hypothetical protein